MIQTLQQPVTFNEFVEWLPFASEYRYELHRGVIFERQKPRGKHSKLSGNLAYDIGTAIRQGNLPYFIPKECIIRSFDLLVISNNRRFQFLNWWMGNMNYSNFERVIA